MTALNIPIQLVSACSTLGDFTPLWFRYEKENHEIETIKVESVVSKKEENYCGINSISYVCWAGAEGNRRLVELRYSVSSHKWLLFRVLS